MPLLSRKIKLYAVFGEDQHRAHPYAEHFIEHARVPELSRARKPNGGRSAIGYAVHLRFFPGRRRWQAHQRRQFR